MFRFELSEFNINDNLNMPANSIPQDDQKKSHENLNSSSCGCFNGNTNENDLETKEYIKNKLLILQIIQAFTNMMRMRDPYTFDHQKRVASLSAAIAKEMALSKKQSTGIYLAAFIHDIGKFRIPIEILCKPGKIDDLEYSLIKTHPKLGFDILNGIDLLKPIARIVLQHHERLNGSGYPNGLLGDQILLESRILGVADVVEAMTSHRPYRPSLGLDTAIEEISQNRGILYDANVVDACLTVLRQNSRHENCKKL